MFIQGSEIEMIARNCLHYLPARPKHYVRPRQELRVRCKADVSTAAMSLDGPAAAGLLVLQVSPLSAGGERQHWGNETVNGPKKRASVFTHDGSQALVKHTFRRDHSRLDIDLLE